MSPPKNPLELINEFSKVAEYKTNIPKQVAFLYCNSEPSEKVIEEISPQLCTSVIKVQILRNRFNQRAKRFLY
jgi:RNA-binding protein YhbY